MNLRTFFTVTVFAAALPALAAPNCNAPQIVVGNNCVLSVALGWGIAGLGTDSIITIFVPPNASGPVDIEVTALNSNLGTAYTGYFGFRGNDFGQSGSVILTLSDIMAGGSSSIGSVSPGQLMQFQVTQICWDPTCTAPPPAGGFPNMFSLQFTLSTPNTTDINPNDIQMVGRFLNGNQVTYEVQEAALHTNSPFSIIPGISLGATAAARFNGTALTTPYDVVSISNFGNPNPISGTATLLDSTGHTISAVPIPPIPPGGAAGYDVIGKNPQDTLGLFPSNIVLPAGSDGVFHGSLVVGLTGLNQTTTGMNIVLSQQFDGNSVLNSFVFHSPVF